MHKINRSLVLKILEQNESCTRFVLQDRKGNVTHGDCGDYVVVPDPLDTVQQRYVTTQIRAVVNTLVLQLEEDQPGCANCASCLHVLISPLSYCVKGNEKACAIWMSKKRDFLG